MNDAYCKIYPNEYFPNKNILIKNINKFISDNSHVIKTCRNCLNIFYSEIKYKDHIEYCKFRKPKKLMPSFKKYM